MNLLVIMVAGPVPGIKTKDFNWEIKGHKNRIITL